MAICEKIKIKRPRTKNGHLTFIDKYWILNIKIDFIEQYINELVYNEKFGCVWFSGIIGNVGIEYEDVSKLLAPWFDGYSSGIYIEPPQLFQDLSKTDEQECLCVFGNLEIDSVDKYRHWKYSSDSNKSRNEEIENIIKTNKLNIKQAF